MTRRDKWKRRPCVLRYFAFRDQVRAHGVELPLAARIVFHVPMPRSWSATKRARMAGKPHDSKPDIDNLVKGLLDAVLLDDKKVWRLDVTKLWAHEAAIIIEEVT